MFKTWFRKYKKISPTHFLRGKEKSIQTVKNILEKHPLIYKPLFGSQGDNIVKINSLKDFENIDNHNNIFYLQEFLETSPSHDYRVLVIKKNNHKYTSPSYDLCSHGHSL